MAPTVVLTFDNLGEAAELEQGTWPPGAPRGRHPSVTRALPLLLDLLDELGLRGTFFVEAQNTADYPDAVRELAARGHELGFHAWRHERWGELDEARERELVARSFAAYADLGVDVRAFRPPGGGLTPQTVRLLRSHGVRWASPKGWRAGLDDAAMAHLPFRWPLVDATYLFGPFDAFRAELRLPAAPLAPDDAMAQLARALRDEPDPLCATLILHPFLMAEDGAWPAYERFLRDLAAGPAAVVPGGAVAAELCSRHDAPPALLG